MSKIWIAKIIDKKVSMSEGTQARFNDWKKENEGKFIRITYETPARTLNQNRFYWAYINIIESETGNDSDDMHEFLKRKLLPPKWIKVLDEEIKIPASTTDLNKIEFGEYLDKISALTGVPIPNPKDLEKYGYILN